MDSQNHRDLYAQNYEYQYENQSYPTGGVPPSTIFYSDSKPLKNMNTSNFQADPLSGFNSMESSYNSQIAAGEISPTSSGIENMDVLINDGMERGYFPHYGTIEKTNSNEYHYYEAEVEQNYKRGSENYQTIETYSQTTEVYQQNTIIIEPVQVVENYSDRAYSSDRYSPVGSIRIVRNAPEKSFDQKVEAMEDVLVNVDEYIKEISSNEASSPEYIPSDDFSPAPIKKRKINPKKAASKIEPGTERKERRKATNRKASANYRAKQVKRQSDKELKKSQQEDIRKQLELDNHAIKMQIEYMMKTFSSRVKSSF